MNKIIFLMKDNITAYVQLKSALEMCFAYICSLYTLMGF